MKLDVILDKKHFSLSDTRGRYEKNWTSGAEVPANFSARLQFLLVRFFPFKREESGNIRGWVPWMFLGPKIIKQWRKFSRSARDIFAAAYNSLGAKWENTGVSPRWDYGVGALRYTSYSALSIYVTHKARRRPPFLSPTSLLPLILSLKENPRYEERSRCTIRRKQLFSTALARERKSKQPNESGKRDDARRPWRDFDGAYYTFAFVHIHSNFNQM